MFLTVEQIDTLWLLERDHGRPDRVMHEHTNEPSGIVWLRWHRGGLGDPDPSVNSPADRNMFIKPDGSRLSWDIQA